MSSGDNETTNPNKQEQRNQTQQESKKRRRQKNNEAQREFQCNCGKSYLSYPALYTHVKNKHGQEMMSSMVKKGRDKNIKPMSQQNSELQKQEQSVTIIQDAITFLKDLPDAQDHYDLKELQDIVGPNNEILKCCQGWLNRSITDPNKVHPDTGLYQTITVDQAFGKFVSKLIGRVTKVVLVEVISVLTAWRNNLNKNYSKFDTSGVNFTNYCQQASPSTILQSVNDLVYQYLDDAVKSYSLPMHIFLHPRRREYNLCRLIYLFAKWLYADRYTNLLLKFNSPDS